MKPWEQNWAIKGQNEYVWPQTIRRTRKESIDAFMALASKLSSLCDHDWRRIYAKGYRAVRVLVKEV